MEDRLEARGDGDLLVAHEPPPRGGREGAQDGHGQRRRAADPDARRQLRADPDDDVPRLESDRGCGLGDEPRGPRVVRVPVALEPCRPVAGHGLRLEPERQPGR